MTDDGHAMNRPQPPPEARLIRLVREAAGIKLPEAARAAGVSKARWSQIETGYESRSGAPQTVTGRAVTIAHMAHAVGLSPERLETEGQRPDAAHILREILRKPPSGTRQETPGRSRGIPAQWDALTDAQKELAAAFIKTLADSHRQQEDGNAASLSPAAHYPQHRAR